MKTRSIKTEYLFCLSQYLQALQDNDNEKIPYLRSNLQILAEKINTVSTIESANLPKNPNLKYTFGYSR